MSLSSWVELAESNEPINATKMIGWGRIAWCLGLRMLKKLSNMPLEQLGNYKLYE